jgi:hypothetical protein
MNMLEAIADAVSLRMTANVELERPSANSDRARCAHNHPGAHSAPQQLSRPLQAVG